MKQNNQALVRFGKHWFLDVLWCSLCEYGWIMVNSAWKNGMYFYVFFIVFIVFIFFLGPTCFQTSMWDLRPCSPSGALAQHCSLGNSLQCLAAPRGHRWGRTSSWPPPSQEPEETLAPRDEHRLLLEAGWSGSDQHAKPNSPAPGKRVAFVCAWHWQRHWGSGLQPGQLCRFERGIQNLGNSGLNLHLEAALQRQDMPWYLTISYRLYSLLDHLTPIL